MQLLAGVCRTLREENCALIGGHTSEGAELSIGLSVNGVVKRGREMKKGKPCDGEVLILTKALGTGAIMAADMRGLASGVWVEGAIDSMLLSNREAAKILSEGGCTRSGGYSRISSSSY